MEVYFDPAVGGDGSTVTDGSQPGDPNGMGNGGHRTLFVPALAQMVAIAAFVVQKAADAATAAASALGGTGSIATSASTLTVGTGDQVLNVGAGKTFASGQKIGVARTSAATTTAMYGTVKDYSGSTLTVTIAAGGFIGSGTFSDWSISPTLYGPPNSRSVTGAGLATGGGDLSADRVITVTAATVADVWGGTVTGKAITPKIQSDANAFQTLVDAATIVWDTNAQGYNAEVTLAGNRIFGGPTNLKDGWFYTWAIIQDATGGRTITSWDGVFDWGALGNPVLSTGANKVDFASGVYKSSTGKLHASFRKAA